MMFTVYKTEQEAGACNEKVESLPLVSALFSPTPLHAFGRLLGVGGEIEMRAPSGVEPLTRGYAVSYLLPVQPMPSNYLIKREVMRPRGIHVPVHVPTYPTVPSRYLTCVLLR